MLSIAARAWTEETENDEDVVLSYIGTYILEKNVYALYLYKSDFALHLDSAFPTYGENP